MLTDAQLTDTRRYLGYPLSGTTFLVTDDQDTVYLTVGMAIMSLHKRLNNLSASEESVLVNTYLANLSTLETAIPAASDNLDTDQAAVWKHNANEMRDRDALFANWRRKLCAFVGVVPGPGLGDGSLSLQRA